jgi:hypothetical protein
MLNDTHKILFVLVALMAPVLVSSPAEAVGTRRFVLDSLKTFEGGELEGVAITSNGEVRAGWTLGKVEIPDATNVWSSVVLPDGSVLLGTGTGGRVYQVKNGKTSIAAETGEMAVSAMVVGFGGDVFAGTFPEGNIYRLKQNQLDGSKLKPWVELKDTEDVWALAFDAKKKALYAATGPDGKLFRLTNAGSPEVHFDSEEAHLVSAAVAPGGDVLTGSNGKALLYRVTAPGRAQVVHDFEGDDVKGIAVAKDGSIFAIANKYAGSIKGLRPSNSSKSMTTAPQPTKAPKPGKGQLMRFDARGVAELMLKDDGTHFVTLALDAAGVPHVGTGAEGKVYSVDANHVQRLVADTEERQIGAMVLDAKTRFVATTDPVVFHAITGVGGTDAVWTSKVLDAGMRAHFGLLEFRADGTVEIQTRSGNTEKPDDSWNAWSGPLAKAAKVSSPAARYLQIRARWGRDANAVLRRIEVAFVTDNARALLTELTAGDKKSNTGGSKVPESGAAPGSPDSKLKLSWKVDNPDNDKLRYRLFYRPLGTKSWFTMLEPNEELTKTSHSWDTSGLPEGRYRVRVDVTDELSNPPDRVTKHSLRSRIVLVDNTAPQLTRLTLNGSRLQGTASDGVGPIARVEFALVGDKSWFPLFPSDSVFDQASETFDVDVSAQVPTGPRLIVVRAYDQAGNRVTRTVSRGR